MKHIKDIYHAPHTIEVYSYDDATQYALLVKRKDGVLVESAYGFESQEDAEAEVKKSFND